MDERLSPAQPTAWFGVIQAGAREHDTTAQIWERIRNYADERSLAIPSNMFTEVNRMRSIATGLTVSSERLMRAADSDAITNAMVGQQIYTRGAEELNALAQLYHVRFELNTISQGEQTSGWYTLDYGGSLPATVGDLEADIEAYGQGLTDAYGVTFVGVGRIEIGAY